MSDNNVNYVPFAPPVIDIIPDTSTLIAYDNYQIRIAIDSNNNGVYDSNDAIVAQFDVQVIKNVYDRENGVLIAGAAAARLAGQYVTNTNLALFINDPTVERYFQVPDPTTMELDPANKFTGGRLTHLVGADFKPENNCKATIPLYVFASDSAYSRYVGEAERIKDFIKEQISTRKYQILDKYSIDPFKPSDSHFVDLKGTPDKPYYGLSFGGLNDFHYGIGGSTIKNASMNIYTYRNGGKICVSKVAFKGEIDDLYDFNLFAKPPADGAARVQFGYNGTDRKNGQIYWYTIKLDQDISLDLSNQQLPFTEYCLN